MDFLFHKISERERKNIKKQAKKIIDDFSKQLSKIKKSVDEPMIDLEKDERKEGEGKCNDFDRKILFENAPNKNKDFIIGEKKKW